MKVRRSLGERIFQVFNYIILSALIVVCIYPIWYVVMASFSDSNSLMSHSGLLLAPLDFTVSAYKKVFENPMLLRSYANTMFILVVGVN